jgi:hypothetical protein
MLCRCPGDLYTCRLLAPWYVLLPQPGSPASASLGQPECPGKTYRTPLLAPLAMWRATGAELVRPFQLAILAEVYGIRGHTAEGLSVLVEALAAVEKTGERFYEAELHRLQGELLLQQVNPDEDQAETCFHTRRRRIHPCFSIMRNADVHNLLRMKRFHGVSAGNVHARSLKLSFRKLRSLPSSPPKSIWCSANWVDLNRRRP